MGRRPFIYWLFLLLLTIVACRDAAESPVAPSEPTAIPAAATETAVAQTSGPGQGDTLRLFVWQAPNMLNPHLTTARKDWFAARITYEPLATYDAEATLVPVLAAEIPTLANGGLAEDLRSVTWRLKQNVQWSDGEPFTAADVEFTYEFVIDPAVRSGSRSLYSSIERLEVIDDYTVKITFDDVNPAWSTAFVGVQGVILPQHVFADYKGGDARNAPANLQPVGTGPYRVVEEGYRTEEVLLLGSELVETTRTIFEPNPFYREEDKPYFGRVELRGGGTAEEAARLVLQTGEVDFAWNLQLDAPTLAALESNADESRVVANLTPFVERILLNRADPNQATETGERSSVRFPHPFFSDADPTNQLVREAFTLAIDREAIAELYPGSVATSNVLALPEDLASPNTSYEYDLEKAAGLLAEAGWVDSEEDADSILDKDGVPLSVEYRTSVDPVRQQVQQIVENALESIGVDVTTRAIDASNFFNRDPENELNNFHFYSDMQELFTGNTAPNPDAYMNSWLCSQIPQEENDYSGDNRERWCEPVYDALYAEAIQATDPDQRRQLFIQLNDMLVNDVVTIPLVHRAQLAGISNSLQGVEFSPWDADVWKIADWRRVP